VGSRYLGGELLRGGGAEKRCVELLRHKGKRRKGSTRSSIINIWGRPEKRLRWGGVRGKAPFY